MEPKKKPRLTLKSFLRSFSHEEIIFKENLDSFGHAFFFLVMSVSPDILYRVLIAHFHDAHVGKASGNSRRKLWKMRESLS